MRRLILGPVVWIVDVAAMFLGQAIDAVYDYLEEDE